MANPIDRYRDLILALGNELDRRRGWQRQAAQILGVDPSYVSRVLSGHLQVVGDEALDRARTRFGLPKEYFTADDPGPEQFVNREVLLKHLTEYSQQLRSKRDELESRGEIRRLADELAAGERRALVDAWQLAEAIGKDMAAFWAKPAAEREALAEALITAVRSLSFVQAVQEADQASGRERVIKATLMAVALSAEVHALLSSQRQAR